MALFSERMGLKPVKSILQIDSIDHELRNSLWNVLHGYFGFALGSRPNVAQATDFVRKLWIDHCKLPIDSMGDLTAAIRFVRKLFFESTWNEAYDIIEFAATCLGNSTPFTETCNVILVREMSGYRFIGKTIVPVSSPTEVRAIESALAIADRFQSVREHLRTAVELLSNRNSPDYRNSIKESISAVEAMCNILTDDPKATLGQAIKKLEDSGVSLHSAFREALSKLYGYTSDADGIRHALLEDSKLDVDDAKFMLVTCSAFANYLAAKSAS